MIRSARTIPVLNVGMTSLIGLAAAAALTAEAEGCSIRYTRFSSEPVLADFVRSAASIELARVVSVEALPVEESQYGSVTLTHRYTLQSISVLFGSPDSQFELLGAAPVEDISNYTCGASLPDDGQDLEDQREIQARVCLAEQGHDGWSALRFMTNQTVPDGMGGISNYDPPDSVDSILVGCGNRSQSFAVGETYLVFRAEDGSVINGEGLNLRLIRAPRDQWLGAVQYFLSQPNADRLPAIAAEDTIAMMERVTADSKECDRVRDGFCNRNSTAIWLRYYDAPWAESLPPFPFPLPIRDGMVDLSGIPSQHAIEPAQAPLADVIAWLSETPAESPQ
ncbi:hypothetical protein [Hyphobacterium marinum]|uniref:YARHG domain-containing protein n=1 Tax=Hyphobacterium marinum TaxID=3116574 RepID=A0ABU7LZ49_9PROT|nr:hypothetical protein [Hyphobacterium sp. Y6023]MEE2566265.1 hypothetical protein [Hyphobacterium sp. Y6023]